MRRGDFVAGWPDRGLVNPIGPRNPSPPAGADDRVEEVERRIFKGWGQ